MVPRKTFNPVLTASVKRHRTTFYLAFDVQSRKPKCQSAAIRVHATIVRVRIPTALSSLSSSSGLAVAVRPKDKRDDRWLSIMYLVDGTTIVTCAWILDEARRRIGSGSEGSGPCPYSTADRCHILETNGVSYRPHCSRAPTSETLERLIYKSPT